MTMVLELCELLTELAERRASALTDCTVTTAAKQSESNSENTAPGEAQASTKLKLMPEAKRQVRSAFLSQPLMHFRLFFIKCSFLCF